MISFLTGQFLWFSCAFFVAGCLVRCAMIYTNIFPKRLARGKDKRQAADVWQAPCVSKKRESASDPVPMSLPTWVLVLLVIIGPLFYQGHAVLLSMTWKISWPALPHLYSDILGAAGLAVTLLAALGIVALPDNSGSRRTTVFSLLFFCALPFFSGLMLRFSMPGYDYWLPAHIALGEALLIAIPCTRLFKILFFFLPSPCAKKPADEA